MILTWLLLEPRMSGATGNLYCGLHDWPDMAFVLLLLRPTDSFADIGANVGSYTVLTAGAICFDCETFEPVAATHRRLLRQLILTSLESRVTSHHAAVGAGAGELRISTDRDSMNQLVSASYGGKCAMAPVLAIDGLPSLRHSACWKLDVEAQEAAVLTRATRTLAEAPPASLPCEDRPPPVQTTLTAAGFQPCTYNPFRRQLIPDSSAPGGNQLWAQNLSWTQERLQSAPAFSVLGECI